MQFVTCPSCEWAHTVTREIEEAVLDLKSGRPDLALNRLRKLRDDLDKGVIEPAVYLEDSTND